MTAFDFSQFEGQHEHKRYKASIQMHGKDVILCEIDVVGGIVTSILLSSIIKGEIAKETDLEEIKGLAYAIGRFAEMVITIIHNGGPDDKEGTELLSH